MNDSEKFEARIDIEEGFTIEIKDSFTAIIDGSFCKSDLIEAVREINVSVEDIFTDAEIAEIGESWAIDNDWTEPE